METTTFKDVEGNFEFTVKTEFLKTCPEPEKKKVYDLLTEYKMNNFFHNPSGPAIYCIPKKVAQYWMNGKILSEEEGQRIAHNHKFNNKLINTIVNDNETPTKSD